MHPHEMTDQEHQRPRHRRTDRQRGAVQTARPVRPWTSWLPIWAGIALVAAACGDSKDLPNIENTAPEILSLLAERESVGQGEAIDVACTAEDAEFDAMSFLWSVEVGEFYGSLDESEISWRAPEDYEGGVVITVIATDGKDESDPESVTVQVVGDRESLSGVVSQSGTGELLEGATVAVDGFSTQTDAEGTYAIEGLSVGNYSVEASLDGYESSVRPYEVRYGPNTLDFSLTRTGNVIGTVRNSQGSAVAGATCRIDGRDLETETDDSGNYILGPIPRSSFTIQISRPGYVNFSDTQLLDSAEFRVDVTLTAEVPGAPRNVTASKSGPTMTVSWNAPTEDTIDGYQVYWKVDTNGTVALPGGSLGRDERQIVVEGEPDHHYRFLVAAISLDGVEGSDLGLSNDLVLTELSTLVDIPAGAVVVGDAVPGQSTERASPHPANPISVPAFRIEQTEVTNQQFFMFLWEATTTGFIQIEGGTVRESGHDLIVFGASKVKLEGNTFTRPAEYANHPVAGVTWYGAEAFARFHGRRLLSEVEWERAARGASEDSGTYPGSAVGYGTRYPWGNDSPTVSRANFGGEINTTRAVRSLPAGATIHWALPVYELSGNVWEWCQDWYGPYQSPHSPPGSGTLKVLRGGSLVEDATRLSAWARFSGGPTTSSPTAGFRCALDGSGRPGE